MQLEFLIFSAGGDGWGSCWVKTEHNLIGYPEIHFKIADRLNACSIHINLPSILTLWVLFGLQGRRRGIKGGSTAPPAGGN